MEISASQLSDWQKLHPVFQDVLQLKPVLWFNPGRKRMASVSGLQVTENDLLEAEKTWQRFAPYFMAVFPETIAAGGIIESELRPAFRMQQSLEQHSGKKIPGKLYVKCDNELPVAGSVKARGGFFEVLRHAEALAKKAGLISEQEDYRWFASREAKRFFQDYSIGVGSTGNLGLSIGIISAELGFHVTVYMSADAKEWKKELLRNKGVIVKEFAGDFSEAVAAGRMATEALPNGYFVDDEKSRELFLGYSVAALRLKGQLDKLGITVDQDHPLFVYLPCGVGGAPGGIAFGLRHVLGDHVHPVFIEPTHSPAVLTGLLTGLKSAISVQDIGIDNQTEADGLAVGRPSSFASESSAALMTAAATVDDEELFPLLTLLQDTEEIKIEPSAAAGFAGPAAVLASGFMERQGIDPNQSSHIVWLTGGALVPDSEMAAFYRRGKKKIR